MLFPFPLGPEWTWLLGVWVIAEVIMRIVLLGIIPGNRRPTTAMAWLLAVFLIPSVGFVLFLLFGNFRLSKRRREQQEAVNHRVRSVTSDLSDPTSEYSGPEWVRSAGELNHRLGSLPMVDGNKVELIPGYEESIKAMTEAIRGAKS